MLNTTQTTRFVLNLARRAYLRARIFVVSVAIPVLRFRIRCRTLHAGSHPLALFLPLALLVFLIQTWWILLR